MTMSRLIPALGSLSSPPPPAACQCFNFSRAEIVQRADIVFEGTVAVVTLARGQLQATIDVTRLEKGPDVTSLTLLTPASTASCGIPCRSPSASSSPPGATGRSGARTSAWRSACAPRLLSPTVRAGTLGAPRAPR